MIGNLKEKKIEYNATCKNKPKLFEMAQLLKVVFYFHTHTYIYIYIYYI